MEGSSTEERAALGDAMRGRLWWCEERGEAEKDSLVNERCAELPGCSNISALDLRHLYLLFEDKSSQQAVSVSGGHNPSFQCPPVGPSPCILLGPVVAPLAATISFPCCLHKLLHYIMHLFSTCDSIRYLVSGFFHPLCFDNSLPSVWKG